MSDISILNRLPDLVLEAGWGMREVLVVSWFRDSGAAREEGALRTTSDLPRGLQETLLIEGVADGKLFPAGESMSTLTCGFGSSFAIV